MKRTNSINTIAILITILEAEQRNGNLCRVGVERLKWWRKNQKKFPSIRAALMTWDREQVRAYVSWGGIGNEQQRSAYTNATAWVAEVAQRTKRLALGLTSVGVPHKEITALLAPIRAKVVGMKETEDPLKAFTGETLFLPMGRSTCRMVVTLLNKAGVKIV